MLRHTRFVLQCDAAQKGFAKVLSVSQDEDNDCLYTITFSTNLVCQGSITSAVSGAYGCYAPLKTRLSRLVSALWKQHQLT